ncbi:MAG: 7-carboxy-7-deazaguanine synthase QueE, partial [Candidatus Poribacteria bacterium]|nr:7-carboxy-7-deazaguanine synthase QueE [Candidatus Poribacteria bacterium]
SELFYSIQGEGVLVGTPSVFFRTSYCNLRCAWCDTPYTSWEPEDNDITVDEAFERIHAYGCRHVVITGGEPFIQGEELAALCERLDAAGHHITIETNATVFEPVRAHLISMSPKLANSIPLSPFPLQGKIRKGSDKTDGMVAVHDAKRINLKVIRRFLAEYDCQVKFVIDAPDDLKEAQRLIDAVPIPVETVVLMAQGITPREIQPKMEWLAEVCKETGFRLSPRLHVDLWGTKRGV